MTAMMNLRVFMSERLSSAAMDIFGEVEKVIALYQAEVSRSREEVRYLQKQLELHRNTAIKREEGSTRSTACEDSEQSQVTVDSTHTNTEVQADIATIKEEQEVVCINSDGLDTDTTTTASFVTRDQEQQDMEFRSTYETPSFLSLCPSAVSSDHLKEWHKQTQKAKESVLAVQRESNELGLNQELSPALPHKSLSTKAQNSDHSFCHLCGKPFRYIGSLMKHIKMHDDQTVNCGICNRLCHNINDLLSHLRCAHRGSYFCHICGKTFSKQCFLIIHSKQHKGSKQFACEDWQQNSRKGAS
ncbi:unnamed protein product [Merluccius merluccius]